MKVLVISRNAWDDTNSIGNTLTNFFGEIEDLEFANIYFRSAKPNNNICNKYYRITEKDVLKNWITPQKIGKYFEWDKKRVQENSNTSSSERNAIRMIHKYNLKFAYKLSNFLWRSEKWINKNLDDFINNFSPDIIVSFVKAAPQYFLTIKYLREKYNIPLFCWIADDEYSNFKNNNQLMEIDALTYILKEAAIVKGCSEQICSYYNSIFHCNATPLYKGCDLSMPVKDYVNNPIKIVYAGNLLYGRKEILNRIIMCLDKYNQKDIQVCLDIYSNTPVSTDERMYYEGQKSVTFHGKKDYEIIIKRLSAADIVLHVESFNEVEIRKTKYSFSTKIIDCLQSGSVLLAIGPRGISSVDYIKKIPGAFVIDNLSNIDLQLKEFFDERALLLTRAKDIREFAMENHDINKNRKYIKNILLNITGGE